MAIRAETRTGAGDRGIQGTRLLAIAMLTLLVSGTEDIAREALSNIPEALWASLQHGSPRIRTKGGKTMRRKVAAGHKSHAARMGRAKTKAVRSR